VSRFYITTAIDYPNGVPHVGHAYERIGADCIARYRRLRGDDVFFLVGMDEHAQKVSQAAAAEGMQPQPYVDRMAEVFRATWDRLSIGYESFYRTSDPGHKAGVLALIERIYERHPDDFFEGKYEGWYCTGCEYFKREADIVDGHCILHPTRTLDWLVEHNWFFRLTKYRDFLLKYHADHPDFLQPEARRNEIVAILESGLEDISVSRGRLGWGIPWPRPMKNGEQQVVWVWFDALPNYLTATGFPGTRDEPAWPAQLHVVGKDITRLHAIIWPAICEAAGVTLPEHVWGHGFALFKGEKVSKSSGVAFDLDAAIDRHGADAFRYFLLREIPWDADGSYTWERFDERYTADLADAFGNLASRVLAMLGRYRAGLVPAAPPTELDRAGDDAIAKYTQAMDALLLHRGAAAAWELVTAANGYVERRAPWAQAKAGDDAALDETLGALARCLARLSVLVSPFIPAAARTLGTALGLDPSLQPADAWKQAAHPSVEGRTTTKIPPLFPKPEMAAKAAP
jgi:methionyl-tRNA synthetase